MDMRDWSDRSTEVQLQKVLELGEFLQIIPPNEKPMQMTLLAAQIWGDGMTRSQEEAYVALADAMTHAQVWKLMDAYDESLRQAEIHMDQLRTELLRVAAENEALRKQVKVNGFKKVGVEK